MRIQHFADVNRLHTRIDDDETKIIRGKYGHIYEWGEDGLLGVMIIGTGRRQYWGFNRAAMQRAGFTITQDGDHEGAATFDPANPVQVNLAIKAAGVKRKKVLSESDRLRRSERMRKLNRAKWPSSREPSRSRKRGQ
jgi:hypothetical protein